MFRAIAAISTTPPSAPTSFTGLARLLRRCALALRLLPLQVGMLAFDARGGLCLRFLWPVALRALGTFVTFRTLRPLAALAPFMPRAAGVLARLLSLRSA